MIVYMDGKTEKEHYEVIFYMLEKLSLLGSVCVRLLVS